MAVARSPKYIPQQFNIVKQIGEGGYGSVFLVKHLKWGEVVLKKLQDTKDIDNCDLDILKHEANILKNLRHPNVVTFYGGRFDPNFCGLFIEFVKYGSVDRFLKKFLVTRDWKIQIIFDISLAMCYLHEQQPPIIHGDLKCQNILIGNDFHAKVCDFGLARIYSISKPVTEHSIEGTLEYIAPEYFRQPRKSKSAKFDVYSFAISAWEIFYQKRAYHDFCDRRVIPASTENGHRPLIADDDDKMPASVWTIVQDCWQSIENERPTFCCIRYSLRVQISLIEHELQQSLSSLMAQEPQIQQSYDEVTTQGTQPNELVYVFGG